MIRRIYLAAVGSLLIVLGARETAASQALKQLEEQIPRLPTDCTASRADALAAAAFEIESWEADRTWIGQPATPDHVLATLRQLISAKQRVDSCVDEVLSLRGTFVDQRSAAVQREMLCNYLRITSQLIDLSGRMRYLLRDGIDRASYDLSPHPRQLTALLDLLIEQRVSIGAAVMTYALFDPPAGSGVGKFPDEAKRKVLHLIAVTRQKDVMPQLADLVLREKPSPPLILYAAEVIRAVGLPQDPLPNQEAPPPAITARPLRSVLLGLDASQLGPDLTNRRNELVRWLDERIKHGISDDVYQLGDLELRAGDWLLMRNPSPYNSFTDLAPGLFTHVGVVAVQEDRQGVRRYLIVDLPERGDRIPATTVDAYLERTLHYFFLRHDHRDVQQKMGEAAAAMIGNETQFDLTFRTDRVLTLKDKPLKGQRINTYCAGFLLICAQQTGAPRDQFFPIPEHPAGGYCLENLAQLGLSIGDSFVSPTGAVFSPRLQLVGRCEPMYSPDREVKEAIYDCFAQWMVQRRLTPSPNSYQALRQKFAELATYNPWLAKTLAKANNVSEHMDLEAAAKAAAVVETLDNIADASRDGFFFARQALMSGPVEQLQQLGVQPEEIQRIQMYRQRHPDLLAGWLDGSLTPRRLRVELVDYYTMQGKKALEERFFRTSPE